MIQSVNSFNIKSYRPMVKNSMAQKPFFMGDSQDSLGKADISVHTGFSKDTFVGNLNGKEFNFKISENLLGKRTLSGTFNGKDFEIVDKSKGISGSFDGKPINIDIKSNMFSSKSEMVGTIGTTPLNLKVEDDTTRREITGKYDNKDLNVDIAIGVTKDSIQGEFDGEKIHLYSKSKGLFKNGADIYGDFECPDELFLILLSSYYDTLHETNAMVAAAAMA